ncbi:hypothetical protein [Actinomadura verrucosospora]|nr:hypothetical protein [Actinomadura verrucosospora]
MRATPVMIWSARMLRELLSVSSMVAVAPAWPIPNWIFWPAMTT